MYPEVPCGVEKGREVGAEFHEERKVVFVNLVIHRREDNERLVRLECDNERPMAVKTTRYQRDFVLHVCKFNLCRWPLKTQLSLHLKKVKR